MEENSFKPEKLLWTTEDFDQMNWHDNRLHGIGFAYEIDSFGIALQLDIDYIFKWYGFENEPGVSGFWISPSTLIFESPSKCNWRFSVQRSNTLLKSLEIIRAKNTKMGR